MNDASKSPVPARLKALREQMAGRGLDVYLVPSADEHQNEYLPAHKMRREAVSGFTGSAGEVAVCAREAHLFVDSRYHLQAGGELPPGLFEVHKVGLADAEDLFQWLTVFEAAKGALRVGFDPFVVTLAFCERLRKALKVRESRLEPVRENLVDLVWNEREAPAPQPAFSLPDDVTGEPAADKLARVRAAVEKAGAGALVLTKLDEVAWLTNLRGSAIPYNPVFEGYLVVEPERAVCYTDTPIPEQARETLKGCIQFSPYQDFAPGLESLAERLKSEGKALWLDKASASRGVELLAGPTTIHRAGPNPVATLKAVKNPVEIDRMRQGHLRSGCAKVRAFSHLDSWLAEGRQVSEAGFAELLEGEYAREEGFKELSFRTIAAYGENGAIVHYGALDPEVFLEGGGLLLVDSGIQILGATTDDTRTIAIGVPTTLHRERYTDVLRAHIRLATQIFPEGTNGQALDAIARSPLWNAGADYGHGTGHGVGAFLNVHEGPQNISPRGLVPLEQGMIVSNEPGYYHAGWGGIRLENLMVVEEMMGLPPHPAGKRWLRFFTLTMIPFDRKLILPERMNADEVGWLEDYHRAVEETLAPLLDPPHQRWLREACRPLAAAS